jgi:signal transduction histidine kinase
VPRTPRSISARARILTAVLSVASIGFAVVGGVTFVVQHERVISEVDERLTSQVESLQLVAGGDGAVADADGASDEDPVAAEDFTSVEDFLRSAVARLVPARNEASVAIIDGVARFRPTTLSGFDISQDQALIDRVAAETATSGAAVVGTARTDAGSLRYIAIPVNIVGDPQQGIYLRAVNLDAELAPITWAVLTYAIAAAMVLAAIGIVGWFVTGRLLAPIQRLREAADAITITDLSPRLSASGNDDISDLSRTVNSMLDRLEDSVDSQRQLLDDVRHELKTPITIVRGHLELMDPAVPDDVQTARTVGIAELDRMSRLVEDIDTLASVEGDAYEREPVDLAALTARMGELVAVIPGHAWTIVSMADGSTTGDSGRLLQAWLQLADNAAKYTPAGSAIDVGSARDDDGVRLWVSDHGPGIPEDMRRRVFRRFDRASGRRSVGGSGLGLAIVDAITTAHGGTCVVTETPGGGATFTIHLPPVAHKAGATR